MKYKIIVVFISAVMILFSGCDLLGEKEVEEIEFEERTLSRSFKAYEGLSYQDAKDKLHKLTFAQYTTIEEALYVASKYSLKTTHLQFQLGQSGIGYIATLNEYNESSDSILQGLTNVRLRMIKRLEENRIEIENDTNIENSEKPKIIQNLDMELGMLENPEYAVISLRAILDEDLCRSLDQELSMIFSSISKVYQSQDAEQIDATSVTDSRGIFIRKHSWEPEYHKFLIRKGLGLAENPNHRYFYWSGVWASQDSIDGLHRGPEPAFEPDIKMYCGTNTLTGQYNFYWAEPDPEFNALSAYSNLPYSYVDTQVSDGAFTYGGGYYSWCIGTTEAEDIIKSKNYYWEIVSDKGNSEASQYRKFGYKLQHFSKEVSQYFPWSIFLNEGDAWAVGTYALDSDNTEVKYINNGDGKIPNSGEIITYFTDSTVVDDD